MRDGVCDRLALCGAPYSPREDEQRIGVDFRQGQLPSADVPLLDTRRVHERGGVVLRDSETDGGRDPPTAEAYAHDVAAQLQARLGLSGFFREPVHELPGPVSADD